jgi:mannose/cellobiose epimerase-like protein (N-acyl-D-glucosamine 2-epimerase family)
MIDRAYQAALGRLRAWLIEDSLPIWADIGVDRKRGGFVEAIGQNGHAIERPRRARVVGRQVYSFHVSGKCGWLDEAANVTHHGANALYRHCSHPDGLVFPVISADGRILDRSFDLYDHAFVLLALASLAESEPQASNAAIRMITAMERFRRRSGGWTATSPVSEALLSNPHMHMLEACLAFERLPNCNSIWSKLSNEIVGLALKSLINPTSGALHEFCSLDFGIISDPSLFQIEPGHQFEWAWLLRSWNARVNDPVVEQAAARLVTIAETYGVDNRGIVIDGLDANLSPVAKSARLWPQTERLKANVQAAALSSGVARRVAVARATQAIEAISCFTATAGRGLWFDRIDHAARCVDAPAPASTLYHIVCAIEYCERILIEIQ